MTTIEEHLTKAVHDLELATVSLYAAHEGCPAVTSLIILPLLKELRELRQKVQAVVEAVQADARQEKTAKQ